MIKTNKLATFLLLVVFLILVYCHFNTMILNDDLPYSLYFRVNNRITDLIGVIKNQYSDYSHINARVFLHFIVQFLLIYDKNLWSLVNPLVIVSTIIIMSCFIKFITKTQTKNIYLVISSTIGYLLLFKFKYLIYWVAGSVNYVWVFLILLLLFVYYYKIGFLKHKKISCIICLIIPMLCETSAIFIIGLLITDIIIQIVINKEDKKTIIKYYSIFLILSILGFSFILFAPSTLNRLSGDNSWKNLSLLDKLFITLPVISSNIFKINLYNLYPIIYISSILYYYYNKDKKKGVFITFLLLMLYTLCYIFEGFFWVALSLCLFFVQSLLFYQEKEYKLGALIISSYLISYSLCVTNEYLYGRVNFHFMLFNYIISLYNYLIIGKNNLPLKIVITIVMCLLIIIEVWIYTYIGQIKKERLISINKVKNKETRILETKIIKSPFDRFHVDANSPVDKDYWAYAAFEDYYKLPKNIEIKIIK